ncbi:MAG: Clp protease N-terminal domain-containing protein [Acidimicrobiales bacterium]
MFERFTTEARSIVVQAQEEARLLKHNYVGTEHLLLAMLRPDLATAVALSTVGIDLEPTRAAVVKVVGEGGSSPSGHIPFTPRAKKVLELSLREAIKLGDNSIRAEHVLLGLVREGEGVAAQVLVQQRAALDQVREAALVQLNRSPGEHPPPAMRGAGGQTPATHAALAVARQLAATGPVGSHHLLEALARSPESAAARVLAALGVDAEALAAKIDEVGLDGTTDLTPPEAAARRATVRLEGDADDPAERRVVIELGDEHTVGLVATMIDVVGGPLRGDDPVAGSLVGLWEAVSSELADLAERLAGPDDPGEGEPEDEPGVLRPVRAAIESRLLRRRRPPA